MHESSVQHLEAVHNGKEEKKKQNRKRDSLTTVLMTDFAEFGLNVSEFTLIIFLLEILHNIK